MKSQWQIICDDQELFDKAIKETQDYFLSQGLDPDDAGFKDIAEYVDSKWSLPQPSDIGV